MPPVPPPGYAPAFEKKGDIPTISTIEHKLSTNPGTYIDAEKQLFANMHLSASETLIGAILQG